MMKLHISVWRETASLVSVINNNVAKLKSSRRLPEAHFIGAPTESPSRKFKAMKIKSFAGAAAVAAFCTFNTFAVGSLGPGFTYQGRLNDGGAPANGNYDMIFNLYDAPTNGNVLGSFSIFGAVPVTNGLFTLELNSYGEFGPNAFNGQARWLQIGVRTNNNNAGNPWVYLSPRQALDPAPHAMFALNAGNSLNASYATNASFASNASNANSVAWANITGIPAGFADGVDNDTTYSAGAGLNLNGANQFSVNFAGSGVTTSAAHSDHGHFGAVWGGNQSFGLGLSVTNGAANSTGLYGQQGTGSGFPYVFGNTAGVWGESSQGSGVYGASASFRGVQGLSLGIQGSGVYGSALSTTGTNYGVYGKSASTNGGVGVGGLAGTASANSTKSFLMYPNAGVVGDSATGNGVVGFSDEGAGVVGSSVDSLGVYGESSNIGVQGYSVSAAGFGVEGVNYNGVAVKASGTGIIQSDAESVVWFPATFPRNDIGISVPHVFANAVSADVSVSQAGIATWPMSLNLPGTLYGQNVTVKSVTIYFQCSAGARSFPSDATLYYTNPDGTFYAHTISAPASNGNGPESMSATVNQQLSANGGFMSVLLSANFGNAADKISYYGVKVVLGHK
jgi:hypothetical protein